MFATSLPSPTTFTLSSLLQTFKKTKTPPVHCSSPPPPPSSMDPQPKRVAVCGGGVIGVCTAYFLAKKGAAVTLIEKSSVACAASGKSGGFLALDWCDGGPLSSLARASFNLHRSLAEELNGTESYGYRPLTTLSLTITESGKQSQSSRVQNLPSWVDGPARDLRAIGSTETTAQVHPQMFTKTLLSKAVEKFGVEVVIGKVDSVGVEGGRVDSVVLEGGRVIESDSVVLALGPWSGKFEMLSSLFRVYGLRAHSIVLEPKEPDAITPHALFLSYYPAQGGKPMDPEVYPRPSGEVYLCGMSSEVEVPEDPEQIVGDPESLEVLKRVASTVSSHLVEGEALLKAEQACFLPCTDDSVPVKKKMVRDVDLYVTVPSFFRCPISLDVMKSPVSLCTGVTYDRTSIERWLDSGNNTCPATMQVLNSKEFVPNRTLQRLIKIWSDSVQTQKDNRVDSAASSVVTREDIEVLVKEMRAKKDKTDRLSKFICFAKESEENCEFLAKFDGFVEMLVGFLVGDKDINFLERVVKVFVLILNKVGDYKALRLLILKQNNDCLSALLAVLKQGRSVSSRIGALKIIEAITLDAESKQMVSEKEGFLLELVKLISLENDPRLIEASLSCLIAISMSKRVKTNLINFKVIAELRKLLTGGQKASVSIIEKALKLLEMVTSLREGRAEFCNDTACVEAVMNKVLKVSSEATEHAVMILWSVCYLFRDGDAQDALVKSNGLTKILLLMQSNCSPVVRQMSGDLLKIFRVNSKFSSCLSSYDTKTTHIMPF